jgi:hypothetical protein
MPSKEAKLNAELARLHAKFMPMTKRQQRDVVKAVNRTRLSVIDLVAEYANKDDKISRARINTLLRDLEIIENDIRKATDTALLGVMGESVGRGYEDVDKAYHSALGLSAEFATTAEVASSVILAELAGRKPTPHNIATYLAHKTGPDGLTLSDRVWTFAGDQKAEIGNVLRRGIIRGDTTASMVRGIQSVYETEAWKARRLALTESNVAYRTAIGYVAEQSEFVAALRLIPGVHRTESCVKTAQEDRHGLGVGVFLPSDTDIYSIHPQCTSYTNYILTEEVR